MLLQLKAIQKRFGGVVALRNGNLSVNSGEVHLLMGENGAGKSTLMKIVAGMFPPDGGEMLWRGQPVSFRNPAEAQAHGIAMVHQECLFAQHLSVAENIFLGRPPRIGARIREPQPHGAAGSAAHRATSFSLAAGLDRTESQSGAEATRRDLPRGSRRVQSADLRRADFLAIRIGDEGSLSHRQRAAERVRASSTSPTVWMNCDPLGTASRSSAMARRFTRARCPN